MKLERIIPAIIAVGLVLDVAGRCLPLKVFTFRAFEAALRYPTATGPFGPNFIYLSSNARGDLPTLGNRSEAREFHTEIFTTDAEGFRQSGSSHTTYSSILMGDSFAAGSGVSDDETLSARLQQAMGMGMYNAGVMEVKSRNVIKIADRLGISSGTVIYAYMERQNLPTERDVSGVTRRHRYGSTDGWKPARIKQVVNCLWDGFWAVTPIEILCRRVFRRLQNDRVFPNPFKNDVRTYRLKNGTEMLFLNADVETEKSESSIDISGIERFRQELAGRNLNLVLLLIPTKWTVYRDVLIDSPGFPNTTGLYLQRLKSVFDSKGIPALDLTPTFLEAAKQSLDQGQTIYFLEDTHWNAEGIRIAAENFVQWHRDRRGSEF